MIVICNGMLRSGSTLQFNIARHLAHESGKRILHQEFIEKPNQADLGRIREHDDDCGVCILKTHHFPVMPDYVTYDVRVLHCHRNLLDIAASIRKKWAEPFDEIQDDLRYLLEVETQLNQLPGGILLSQPYELLTNATAAAAYEIADHLSLDLDAPAVNSAVAPLRVDLVKASLNAEDGLKTLGDIHVDPTSFFHSDHISDDMGLDGSWRQQLSTVEIDAVRNVFGDWFQSHGYNQAVK